MKSLLNRTIAILVVFIVTSCSLWPEVSTEELEQIVRRDGVPFDAESIPEEVLDRFASYRVVLVGETHFLREHREFMAELLRELHGRGFRQLLVEWTQVANWLLADFVNEGGLEPDWEPPGDISAGVLARAIRDFNRTLPESERIQIYGIDVTLQDYGGDESFLWSLGRLAQHLPDPGPLSEFPQGDYDTPERQRAFGFAGLRLGYALTNANLAEYLSKAMHHFPVNRITAKAAIAALSDSSYLEYVKREIKSGRKYLTSALNALPDVQTYPSHTNFVLTKFTGSSANSYDITQHLVQEGIIVRDYTGKPGLEGQFIRITVGTMEQNEACVKAIEQALSQ